MITSKKLLSHRKNWTINPTKITVIDNFFDEECLKMLKYRLLYTHKADKIYDNYYAVDYKENDYLTSMIAEEIKNKILLPPFQRAWGFVYNNSGTGVGLHCDPSVVNLNIWLSSDKSVKNKSKNGLNIYKLKPPKHWTRHEWNENPSKAIKLIKSKKIKPLKVPYKYNRAIFFDGAYFHTSNEVSMKDGIENKRISFTMLFGEQLEKHESF